MRNAASDAKGAAARPRLLLVDFENVQPTDLSGLDDDFNVVIFVGVSQKNVPLSLVTSAQKLGSRVEWQRVSGEGRNALDFFIACHLGRVLERAPGTECVVLSRDKGFDPLLRQLNANGLACRRITSRAELETRPRARHEPKREARPETRAASQEEPNYRRVLEVLGNLEKRSRPRKRRTLSQAISAMFQKKISQREVDRIIDAMLDNRLITESNNAVTYEF
jgi:hypothetical protein